MGRRITAATRHLTLKVLLAFLQISNRIYTVNLSVCSQEEETLFRREKHLRQTYLSEIFSVDFLLVVPMRLLCRRYFSLFARQWFQIRRLFCHCLFRTSPSFVVSGRLCFVIVQFPGYHLQFFVRWKWIQFYLTVCYNPTYNPPLSSFSFTRPVFMNILQARLYSQFI